MSSMMKRARACALLSSLACAGLASADDVSLPDVVVWSNIDNGTNVIRVTTSGGVVNPASCTNPDSYLVLTTLSQQTQSRTLAVLLTAKAMGRPVSVRVIGCESNRPAIVGAFF